MSTPRGKGTETKEAFSAKGGFLKYDFKKSLPEPLDEKMIELAFRLAAKALPEAKVTKEQLKQAHAEPEARQDEQHIHHALEDAGDAIKELEQNIKKGIEELDTEGLLREEKTLIYSLESSLPVEMASRRGRRQRVRRLDVEDLGENLARALSQISKRDDSAPILLPLREIQRQLEKLADLKLFSSTLSEFRPRWRGLDIEITVDPNWDAHLPTSLSALAKRDLLEKMLCKLAAACDTTHLYISRVTLDAAGNAKAWFFKDELSLEAVAAKPFEFPSMTFTPTVLAATELDARLVSKGTSAYASAIALGERWRGSKVEVSVDRDWDRFLEDSEEFVPLSPKDKEDLLHRILLRLDDTKGTERVYLTKVTLDKGGYIKVWYFTNPEDFAKSEECITLPLRPVALTEAKKETGRSSPSSATASSRKMSNPFADVVPMLEEVEDNDISLLVSYLTQQVSALITEEKERPGVRGHYTIPSVIDSFKQNLKDLRSLELALNRYLNPEFAVPKPGDPGYPEYLVIHEQVQQRLSKFQAQLGKTIPPDAVPSANTALATIKAMQERIGEHLPRLIAAEEVRQRTEAELKAFEATREGYSTYHHGTGMGTKVRVAEKWHGVLPMEEKQKEVLLNQMIQHLCSREGRESLPPKFARPYTDLYISRIMQIGEHYKVWLANTSIPFQQDYPQVALEIPVAKLAQIKPIPLPAVRDTAYDLPSSAGSQPPIWVQMEIDRDTRIREAQNAAADSFIKEELKAMAPVEIILNPQWGDELKHLERPQKAALLNRLLHEIALKNENTSRDAGRATSLYISQVTIHKNVYTIWYADPRTLDQASPPIKTYSVPRTTIDEKPEPDPKSKKGGFAIAPSPGEAKEEDPRLKAFNFSVGTMISSELEDLASAELKVDFFDTQAILYNREHQLRELQRRLKKATAWEEKAELKDTETPDMVPATLEAFHADTEVRRVQAAMDAERKSLDEALQTSYQRAIALQKEEEKVRDRVSRRVVAHPHSDQEMNRDQIALPLALALGEVIPEFMDALDKMKVETVDKVKDKVDQTAEKAKSRATEAKEAVARFLRRGRDKAPEEKKRGPAAKEEKEGEIAARLLAEKKAKALGDFIQLYKDIVNLDFLLGDPNNFDEARMQLTRELNRMDRDVLLAKINAILGKESLIASDKPNIVEKPADKLAQVLKKYLADQLAAQRERKDEVVFPFILTEKSLVKPASLAADTRKMLELATAKLSKAVQEEVKNFNDVVKRSEEGDKELAARVARQEAQVFQLARLLHRRHQDLIDQRQAEQLRSARAANASTAGEVKAVAEVVQAQISYLAQYLEDSYKKYVSKEAKDAGRPLSEKILALKAKRAKKDVEGFKKVVAAEKLLLSLQDSYQRLQAIIQKDLGSLTIEQHQKLMADKEKISTEIRTAFSVARADIGKDPSAKKISRGFFATKIKKDKTSPIILINDFLDPTNLKSGFMFFDAQQMAIHEKHRLTPGPAEGKASPAVRRDEYKVPLLGSGSPLLAAGAGHPSPHAATTPKPGSPTASSPSGAGTRTDTPSGARAAGPVSPASSTSDPGSSGSAPPTPPATPSSRHSS